MLLGHPKDRLSNHLSICFTDVKDDETPLVHGESLLYLLDAKGVLVSTGSACNSQSNDSAYVIKSIKVPEKFHYSILRFTFSNHTTKRDVDLVINKLIESMEFLHNF
jgi:cysteine desulfurase